MERRPLRDCSPIPKSPGVYRIWDGDEYLYVGVSGNLNERVSLHLSGDVPTSRVAEYLVLGETFTGMKKMSAIARQRIEDRGFTVDWLLADSRAEAVQIEHAEMVRLRPLLNVAGNE